MLFVSISCIAQEVDIDSIAAQANAGDMRSLSRLGECYYRGIGVQLGSHKVQQDFQEAHECFLRASKAGDTLGKALLGEMYYKGDYVSKDYNKSFQLFQEAATDKNSPSAHAMRMLSACYRYGLGTEIDMSKEQYWFEMAEKQRRIEEIVCQLEHNMVYVEGGTFTMGATSEQGSDAWEYEKPAHQVTLSSFSIGKYEVTQEEWEAVMGSNPSHFKGAKRPVDCVSWDDCQTFIRKLNAMTGKHFRLPTEAEWEYAARGGNRSRGYKYSGSDIPVAWINPGSNGETHPVGRLKSNEIGLYDMSGNVWEWCQDWYSENYYGCSPSHDPKGPSSGSYRVRRGGSYYYDARQCRVSNRWFAEPNYRKIENRRMFDLGLRLAL